MTDDAATKSSMLIRVQLVTGQLAACHMTNGVDEILTVEIFKTILVRIVCVGTTIEIVGQRVFDSILVVSILEEHQNMCTDRNRELTRYSSSLYMKGVMC